MSRRDRRSHSAGYLDLAGDLRRNAGAAYRAAKAKAAEPVTYLDVTEDQLARMISEQPNTKPGDRIIVQGFAKRRIGGTVKITRDCAPGEETPLTLRIVKS